MRYSKRKEEFERSAHRSHSDAYCLPVTLSYASRSLPSESLTAGDMADRLNPSIVSSLRLFGYMVSLLSILLGCAVLVGWHVQSVLLVTVRPGLAAMAPLTACGFVLAGLSLGGHKLGKSALAVTSASILFCVGASILTSYALAGHDLLNPLVGNRMSAAGGTLEGHTGQATALAFLLLGISLMTLEGGCRMTDQVADACAIIGALVSGVALLGHAYDVEGLYATAFYRSTALHSACGLFMLFLACFVYDPQRGWPAVIASARPSGGVARIQLLFATLVPSGMGLILVREVRSGGLAPSLAIALIVVSATIPMVLRIFVDGRMLETLDMQLRNAIGLQQNLNNELEARVQARTADLQKAEAALRQSQKMEAIGQLTSGIAHDFNNFMTGIIGSLQLLQIRLSQGKNDGIAKYATTAESAAKRAAKLTHQLLAFSRKQMLDPTPLNINQLVDGIEGLVRGTVGPDVEIVIVGEEDLWTTLADQSQLESALLNLVINARDAMPDGGKIVIKTANKALDAQMGGSREMTPGQYVLLCVSDNGTGMMRETISRAFDPFFTTKPTGMGTGLGLSMVYGFARQSGGQARIHSEIGKGTTASIYLPRFVGEASIVEPVTECAARPLARDGETVLIVDDEPSVRGFIREVLEDLGYAILDAEDGQEGLNLLGSTARIDLLISDIGLPGGMSGVQVADAAHALRPDLKILFVTGYAEHAALNHGRMTPGIVVLRKPFAVAELIKGVGAVLGKSF